MSVNFGGFGLLSIGTVSGIRNSHCVIYVRYDRQAAGYAAILSVSWQPADCVGSEARASGSRIKMADSIEHCQIRNITADYQYLYANGTDNETIVEESRRIFLPIPALAVTDEQGETLHRQDGATLIIVMALLVLTIITIWVFRAWRIRVCHSTGLAMLYGTEGRVV